LTSKKNKERKQMTKKPITATSVAHSGVPPLIILVEPHRGHTSWPTTGLAAGGGGKSSIFPKPTWQVGRGVPQDNARDVPDLSLAASTHAGYLICSAGSCVNGFRASDDSLTVIGGTSVGAPVFAGIIALLDQKVNSAQGNVNPGLYVIASAVPAAFHDIVNGANWLPCQAGSPGCAFGVIGYTTARGYDLATGLGSIDVFKLLTAWSSLFAPR